MSITHRTERAQDQAATRAAGIVPAQIPDTPNAEDWYAEQMHASVKGKPKLPIDRTPAPLSQFQQATYEALTKPMTAREVAEAMGCEPTSAGGYLSTLCGRGLTRRTGETKTVGRSHSTVWERVE